MHRRALACLAALALTFAASGSAVALNLIPNDTFDTDLAGWIDISPGEEFWDSGDANGNPNSGSAGIAVTNLGNGSGNFIAVCVPIAGGASYLFGGDAKFQSFVPANLGDAKLQLGFWTSPSCDLGGQFGGAANTTQNGQWVHLSGSGQAPADAVAASLYLEVDKTSGGAGANMGGFFDNVFIAPEPSAAADALTAFAPLTWLVGTRRRQRGSHTKMGMSRVVRLR